MSSHSLHYHPKSLYPELTAVELDQKEEQLVCKSILGYVPPELVRSNPVESVQSDDVCRLVLVSEHKEKMNTLVLPERLDSKVIFCWTETPVSIEHPYVLYRRYRNAFVYVHTGRVPTLASESIADYCFITTCFPSMTEQRQWRAIRSWMSYNIPACTVNTQEEVDAVAQMWSARCGGSGLPIINVGKCQVPVRGKPLVYFRDFLRRGIHELQHGGRQAIAFINSDILVDDNCSDGTTVYDFLQRTCDVTLADDRNAFVSCTRFDFAEYADLGYPTRWQPAKGGFDIFIFRNLDFLEQQVPMNCRLRIGLPWWDFAPAFWAMRRKLPYVIDENAVFFHKTHLIQWQDSWSISCNEFVRIFPELDIIEIDGNVISLVALQTVWEGSEQSRRGTKNESGSNATHELGLDSALHSVLTRRREQFRSESKNVVLTTYPRPITSATDGEQTLGSQRLYLGCVEFALGSGLPAQINDILKLCLECRYFQLGYALGKHTVQNVSRSIEKTDPELLELFSDCGILSGRPAEGNEVLRYLLDNGPLPNLATLRRLQLKYQFCVPTVKDSYQQYPADTVNQLLSAEKVQTQRVTFVIAVSHIGPSLFSTVNSFLNCCLDAKTHIGEWICLFGSADEQQLDIAQCLLPFFRFLPTTQNDAETTLVALALQSPYIFSCTDEWQFLHPQLWMQDCQRIVCDDPSIGRIYMNPGGVRVMEEVDSLETVTRIERNMSGQFNYLSMSSSPVSHPPGSYFAHPSFAATTHTGAAAASFPALNCFWRPADKATLRFSAQNFNGWRGVV